VNNILEHREEVHAHANSWSLCELANENLYSPQMVELRNNK